MTAPDPMAALLHAADAAASGRPLSPLVGAWLAAGVRAYLAGEPLEIALRLAGYGWPARTRHRYAIRNSALHRAAALVGFDCARLAAEIRRFGGHRWQCWRDRDQPPKHASPLERELWQAFSAGAPVPTSARQLRRILAAAAVDTDSGSGFD